MRYYITVLFCTVSLSGYCQNKINNAVYFELGGSAFRYSVNFEKAFANNVLLRIGTGIIPRSFAIPVMAGKYFGVSAHHFEMVGGVTYFHWKEKKIWKLLSIEMNYLFQLS